MQREGTQLPKLQIIQTYIHFFSAMRKFKKKNRNFYKFVNRKFPFHHITFLFNDRVFEMEIPLFLIKNSGEIVIRRNVNINFFLYFYVTLSSIKLVYREWTLRIQKCYFFRILPATLLLYSYEPDIRTGPMLIHH